MIWILRIATFHCHVKFPVQRKYAHSWKTLCPGEDPKSNEMDYTSGWQFIKLWCARFWSISMDNLWYPVKNVSWMEILHSLRKFNVAMIWKMAHVVGTRRIDGRVPFTISQHFPGFWHEVDTTSTRVCGWGGVGHVNVPCKLHTLLMFRTCQDVGQGLGWGGAC